MGTASFKPPIHRHTRGCKGIGESAKGYLRFSRNVIENHIAAKNADMMLQSLKILLGKSPVEFMPMQKGEQTDYIYL